MGTILAPIELKNGHQIHREMMSFYWPYCGICKKRVLDFQPSESIDEATRMLHLHIEGHLTDADNES